MPSVLGGCNLLVLVYGSSGTGKGHSFQGKGGERGLLSLCAEQLFSCLATLPSFTSSFLTMSAYQIQSSSIVDLLSPCTRSPLHCVEHRTLSACVDELSFLPFASASELNTLLAQAFAVSAALVQRGGGARKPHVVVEWRVELEQGGGGAGAAGGGSVQQSLVRWVQCAGSGGASLKLNAGLQAMSAVIGGLAAGKDSWSLPFASSSLTRLLQFGLGGNAHCLFLACIDCKDGSLLDTRHALELAEQSRRIKNTVRPNRSSLAQQLSQHTDAAAQELASYRLRLLSPLTSLSDCAVQRRSVKRSRW